MEFDLFKKSPSREIPHAMIIACASLKFCIKLINHSNKRGHFLPFNPNFTITILYLLQWSFQENFLSWNTSCYDNCLSASLRGHRCDVIFLESDLLPFDFSTSMSMKQQIYPCFWGLSRIYLIQKYCQHIPYTKVY